MCCAAWQPLRHNLKRCVWQSSRLEPGSLDASTLSKEWLHPQPPSSSEEYRLYFGISVRLAVRFKSVAVVTSWRRHHRRHFHYSPFFGAPLSGNIIIIAILSPLSIISHPSPMICRVMMKMMTLPATTIAIAAAHLASMATKIIMIDPLDSSDVIRHLQLLTPINESSYPQSTLVISPHRSAHPHSCERNCIPYCTNPPPWGRSWPIPNQRTVPQSRVSPKRYRMPILHRIQWCSVSNTSCVDWMHASQRNRMFHGAFSGVSWPWTTITTTTTTQKYPK